MTLILGDIGRRVSEILQYTRGENKKIELKNDSYPTWIDQSLMERPEYQENIWKLECKENKETKRTATFDE